MREVMNQRHLKVGKKKRERKLTFTGHVLKIFVKLIV